MNDKHNKLDDFLRDQLNDASEDASWNVPGDHVFENAQNALPKKKNRRRFVWWILPLLFLAVFAGRELMHRTYIDQLENKISALEESISTPMDVEPLEHASSEKTLSPETIVHQQNEHEHSQVNPEMDYSTMNISEESAYNTVTADQSGSASELQVTDHSPATLDKLNLHQTANQDFSSDPKLMEPEDASLLGYSGDEPSDMTLRGELIEWNTDFLPALPVDTFVTGRPGPVLTYGTPVVSPPETKKTSLPWSFGVLAGGNQSWLTMNNIPENPGKDLYEYDNHQPGIGLFAFVQKPLSKKFALEGGIGYQLYQNKSTLEDDFLFDEDKVVMMPDGKEFYQSSIDIVNPLGDYNTMLGFRVSDEMHENDVIKEVTSMKQKMHVVHLDVSLRYEILSIHRFSFSAGAGLGVGYLAGLNNDFKVSCYHDGKLQGSQTETPGKLTHSQRWYSHAIGKLDIGYQVSDRTSIRLEALYRSGLTSLRRGTEVNGSQTYIHALGLSVGFTQQF